ncbi:hypothetical protein C8Q80DRAFT_1195975 [Daedaleopsis nitida]|nr:hypothetical protein C8Q80DRAFT_1195975 [Daedaleopsis nitida]
MDVQPPGGSAPATCPYPGRWKATTVGGSDRSDTYAHYPLGMSLIQQRGGGRHALAGRKALEEPRRSRLTRRVRRPATYHDTTGQCGWRRYVLLTPFEFFSRPVNPATSLRHSLPPCASAAQQRRFSTACRGRRSLPGQHQTKPTRHGTETTKLRLVRRQTLRTAAKPSANVWSTLSVSRPMTGSAGRFPMDITTIRRSFDRSILRTCAAFSSSPPKSKCSMSTCVRSLPSRRRYPPPRVARSSGRPATPPHPAARSLRAGTSGVVAPPPGAHRRTWWFGRSLWVAAITTIRHAHRLRAQVGTVCEYIQ